jgi:type VI secretion system secreted protein Hcp
MATVDMFLKLDGIDGESTDSKHSKEIEIDAFHLGVVQTGKTASATGGGGAGKVRGEDILFRARPSTASPNLYLYCCNGQPITKGTFTIRVAGKDQQERIVYKFNNALVSSYRTTIGFDRSGDAWDIEAGGAGADDWIQWEYFSLNLADFQVAYSAQKPDGTMAGAITKGWNFTTNKTL